MTRLFCWLGLHEWLVHYRATQEFDIQVVPWYRECLSCGREEDFA